MYGDTLVTGSGVSGLILAYQLRVKRPARILRVVEKERDIALHASGQGSGEGYAGSYSTRNSLKVRLPVEKKHRDVKAFSVEYGVLINEYQKLKEAKDAIKLENLHDLCCRGVETGVDMKLVSEKKIGLTAQQVKTYKEPLFLLGITTVETEGVRQRLREVLEQNNVAFHLRTRDIKSLFQRKEKKRNGTLGYGTLINVAGLYAEVLTIIPFKGVCLKTAHGRKVEQTSVCLNPRLLNPFLGTYYATTQNTEVELGSISIFAFWRKNYKGWKKFKLIELFTTVYNEFRLFACNVFDFREQTAEKVKRYKRKHLLLLIKHLKHKGYSKYLRKWSAIDIKAQLLDTKNKQLIMDFMLKGEEQTIHLLNAVSSVFICSFPFLEYVIEKI